MKSILMTLAAMFAPLTGCGVETVRAGPDILDGVFRPGFTSAVPNKAGPVSFRVIEVGALSITSGRIVAADPLVSFDAAPFTFKAPPGRYPVRLAVADLGDDHYRVAMARVDFSDSPVARWEMALKPGQSLRTLKRDEIFGYAVDSGTGAFADADAFAWLKARYANASMAEQDALSNKWILAGDEEGARHLPHLFMLMDEAGPSNNIAMFSSGWGDGLYASWVGYSADGRVTALVTDFGVVKGTREG